MLIAVAIATAKPNPAIVAPFAYSAPLIASPAVVTATSSQYFARNHNYIAAAPIVAAAPAPLTYAAAYPPYYSANYVL